MTKATHTPGPWHTSSTHLGDAYDIGAENGANIALVSGPAENGADEFKANARLIAAAPDLAVLLVELIDIEGPCPGTTGWATKVRAALQKAGWKP